MNSTGYRKLLGLLIRRSVYDTRKISLFSNTATNAELTEKFMPAFDRRYLSTANRPEPSIQQRSNAKQVREVSSTVVNGVTVEFTPGDRSHPQFDEIYALLQRLEAQITSYEQYTNSDGHAERLALAFNFVVNPKATSIQLVTDLRMCPSCHSHMKGVAKLRQCEIVVRDANRVHRFYKSGQCSCKDYF